MTDTLANAIGLIGTACIIFAYGYATARSEPNPFVQHGINLLGAAFLTVSLLVNFNLASLVLEFFWAAIAIWGLIRAWRGRERGRKRGAAA